MNQKPKQNKLREPQVADIERLIPSTSALRPDFTTLQQVRAEMTAHYFAAKRGDMATQELKCLIYALTQIAKLIELDKLEERLNILDEMARAITHTH